MPLLKCQKSAEDIAVYGKDSDSHDKSGYYRITDGPRNFSCELSYIGLRIYMSCEDISNSNPEASSKMVIMYHEPR